MREVLEFRIVEKWADLLLTPDQGVLLCDSVRKLEVESSDPPAAEVCRLRRECSSTASTSSTAGTSDATTPRQSSPPLSFSD
jgi:hypothetical protein